MMWDRKALKQRAKEKFKANYWKCVLIGLLLSLIMGGHAGGSGSFGSGAQYGFHPDTEETIEMGKDQDEGKETDTISDGSFDMSMSEDGTLVILDEEGNEVQLGNAAIAAVAVAVLIGVILVFLVVFILVGILDAFVINPFQVGCYRFFYKNLSEPARISNLGYGFDNNYKETAKTMFFRDLYLVLWSMLLIVPGIVKGYEYMMIPYLLADDPTMTKEKAFEESRRMMTGQKWNAFVLDLSFIGWNILSLFTCGLLSVFYVNPYKMSAHAALYETLKYGYNESSEGMVTDTQMTV